MNKKISETLRIEEGVLNADIATDRTSAYYDATGYRRFASKLFAKDVGSDKVATVQLLQATDSSGTDSKALSTEVSVTSQSSPSGDVEAIAEAQDTDFDTDNGFTHIAVKVTSDDTTVLANANLIMANGRFNPSA
jgi:hypothetical protein